MPLNLIINVLFVFLISFPSFAFANYDKQCDISFQSYVSPTFSKYSAECIFSAKKSGEFSFKLSGKSVTPIKCFSEAGLDIEQMIQIIKLVQGEKFIGEQGVLLIKEHGELISGKMTTNSFPDEGMEFPPLKKDLDGIAKATLDTGISIKLKVKKSAELTLASGWGTMLLSGPCKKYNASSTSSSKIDKAKSTCKEIGFTAGTEKFGECVLKMMEN